MELYFVMFAFLVVLAVTLQMTYKRGYRKGARMVLDSWKKTIEDLEDNDVNRK